MEASSQWVCYFHAVLRDNELAVSADLQIWIILQYAGYSSRRTDVGAGQVIMQSEM